jgi:RimJ/RimL family protein N-acetyltransferase
MPTSATLPDGKTIAIRPIEPGDEAHVESIYDRMSPESRRRRFLVAPSQLGADDLRRLTDVDHRRHEALLAFDLDSGEAIGEARYVRSPDDRETAEVAAMVPDAWQRRGIATALLGELTERARANGVRRYTAFVAVDNEPVLRALEREGARRAPAEADEVELVLDFPPEGVPERLAAALRWAGSRQLRLLGRLARRIASMAPR